MSEQAEDFWPDGLGVIDEVTPLLVLKEQAAALGRKTRNMIEAAVETTVRDGWFRHTLKLRVPTIGDYSYKILTISHGADPYPVEIWNSLESDNMVKASGLEDFKAKLKGILSSERIKKVLNNLLTYAQS
jgi:hypothetical protein